MQSDLVPSNDPPDRLSRQVAREARRAKESTDLEAYIHGLAAGAEAQKFQLDTWAAHDAAGMALEGELRLLKRGISEVESPAGAEILAGWLGHVVNSDHRRFSRRFGG
jgi:hypothetical protein